MKRPASRWLRLVVVAGLLSLSATGCASAYTSIYKVDDNSYYLTRIRANRSTLYKCAPIGQSADLRCVEISTPE